MGLTCSCSNDHLCVCYCGYFFRRNNTHICMAIRRCSVLTLDVFSFHPLCFLSLFCFVLIMLLLSCSGRSKHTSYVLSKMTSIKQNCQACVNAILELKLCAFSFLPLLMFCIRFCQQQKCKQRDFKRLSY